MTLKRLIQSLDLSVSTGNYLLGVMKVKGKVIRHNLIPYAFVRKMVRTRGCFRNLISAGFVEEAQVFGERYMPLTFELEIAVSTDADGRQSKLTLKRFMEIKSLNNLNNMGSPKCP